MPFISYAQNSEDVMLWRALREVETGFYVDVGAGDPRENSVTCAFYERGWSGVNVEPFEEDFEKLKQERSRDINLNVWVGNKPGVGRLFVSSGFVVSRSKSDNGAELDRASDSSEQAVLPSLTLTQIVEDCPLTTILRGATQLLQQNHDLVIVLEFWPYGLRKAGSAPEELLDFLHKAGFSIFRCSNPMTREQFTYRSADWNHSSRFCNLVATRTEIRPRMDTNEREDKQKKFNRR